MRFDSIAMRCYPISIVEDRYSGVYSGGAWVAIGNSDSDLGQEVIDGLNESDCECAEFWDRARDFDYVAVGPTPDAALDALHAKRFKAIHGMTREEAARGGRP